MKKRLLYNHAYRQHINVYIMRKAVNSHYHFVRFGFDDVDIFHQNDTTENSRWLENAERCTMKICGHQINHTFDKKFFPANADSISIFLNFHFNFLISSSVKSPWNQQFTRSHSTFAERLCFEEIKFGRFGLNFEWFFYTFK